MWFKKQKKKEKVTVLRNNLNVYLTNGKLLSWQCNKIWSTNRHPIRNWITFVKWLLKGTSPFFMFDASNNKGGSSYTFVKREEISHFEIKTEKEFVD